eukprot:3159916-Pleurochrysis_carterae.AAC.4
MAKRGQLTGYPPQLLHAGINRACCQHYVCQRNDSVFDMQSTCVNACLLAGIDFARELNKIPVYRHHTWYVNLLVREERESSALGVATSAGTTTLTAAQKRVQRLQTYRSSAVEHILSRVAAQEDNWHSVDSFATPAKLRLQQQLRTRRLKCDMLEPVERVTALSAVSAKAAITSPMAPTDDYDCHYPTDTNLRWNSFSALSHISIFCQWCNSSYYGHLTLVVAEYALRKFEPTLDHTLRTVCVLRN